MRFKIHDGNSDDYVIVSGDTIEEVRERAAVEVKKRFWQDPWSESVEP